MRLPALALALPALVFAVSAAAQTYTGQASVSTAGTSTQPSFTVTTTAFDVTGQIASPRGRLEQLLVWIQTTSEQTIGEPGISGRVKFAAHPIDGTAATRPFYERAVEGRAARIDDTGLVAVDVDDGAGPMVRDYYEPAGGERLFETVVPVAVIDLPGPFLRRRFAAFAAVLDGPGAGADLGDKAVGLLIYAAGDRVIREILIEAADAKRARELRSIWDERFRLAWSIDGPPVLQLRFGAAGIALNLPVKDDDLLADAGAGAKGLTLSPRPQAALHGGWRVASAAAAPWVKEAPAMPMKDKVILFGREAVRSGTVLECARPVYETAAVPAEGLFLGAGLTQAQAEAIGIRGEAPSVTLTCGAGVFAFHRAADGRFLFAQDNVIYGLERTAE